MNDDLDTLKDIMIESLNEDLIEIQFKNKNKGIYTKNPTMISGEELLTEEKNKISAFNLKSLSWEIINLEEIEYAETVDLLYGLQKISP